MMIKKLDQEKNDLKKLLKLDTRSSRENQASVAKLLNYICLENLNNQILAVFK